jgi:hypothetical protein
MIRQDLAKLCFSDGGFEFCVYLNNFELQYLMKQVNQVVKFEAKKQQQQKQQVEQQSEIEIS